MSLNAAMSSNDSSNLSVSVQSSSNDVLPKFPSQRERQEFRNWMFKVESFFAAKNMTDVINHRIISDDERDRGDLNDDHVLGIKLTASQLNELRMRANKAYNYIIQSLNPKQIQLVSQIPIGDAYTVLKTLKNNYGIIKSTTTIMSLLSKLHLNRKTSNETMNDYFSRIDRMMSDVRLLDSTIMNDNMKKYFIISGLSDDNEWKLISTLISQLDVDNTWSIERLQQYLIDQEDKKTLQQASTLSSSSSNQKQKHVEVDDNINDDSIAKAFNAYRGRSRGRSRGGRSRGRGNYYQNNNRNQYNSSSINHRGRFQRGRGSLRNINNQRQNNTRNTDKQSSSSSNVRCYTCNKLGHTSSQCRSNPEANIQCYTCGKYGHTSSSCFQNQRKRPYNSYDDQNASMSSSSSESDKRQKTFAYLIISEPSSSLSPAAFHSISTNSTDWILDGGATDHYCSSLTLMHDIISLSTPRSIITANGTSSCNIMGKVNIDIDDCHRMTLHDVLYVPDFKVNLMSVFRITQTGADVIYTAEKANIMRNSKTEVTFPRQRNMYMLSSMLSSSCTSQDIRSKGVNYSHAPHIHGTSNIYTISTISSESILPNPVISSSNNNIERLAKVIHQIHLKHGHVNYNRLLKMNRQLSCN
jgi:hypothetical protein